ncbi:MAG TPA: VWA domain-containing protein, partial [Vicinamibacteria bacterium]
MSLDLLATLLLAAAPSAQAPPPREAPRFAAEATLVTVDAVVLDADGRPVRGLVAGDFAVLEDGLAQAVTSFEAIDVAVAPAEDEPERPVVSTNMAPAQEAGRTFAVVWDGVHISPQGEARAKEAVARFLGHGVREGDSVCLVSTAGTTWWTARGVRGRDTLLRLLDGLRGERVSALPPNAFISDFEAVRIVEYGDAVLAGAVWRRLIQAGVTFDPDEVTVALVGVPRAGDQQAPSTRERAWLRHHAEVEGLAGQLYAVVQNRRRAALGTLERVIDSLTTRGGRKSVLLVSEGFVADGNTPRFREVIDAARRANAAVYFIDVRGLLASVEDVVSGVGQAMGRDAQEGASLQRVRTSLDDESSGAELVADAS